MRYERATDLDSWRIDSRIAQRGFTHPWTSLVAPGNGEDLFVDVLADHLSADAVVVDVGCGHGELTLWMAARCRRVIGVDANATYLALARELAEEREVRNVEFHAVALEPPASRSHPRPFPLSDGAADLVVSRRGPGLDRWLDEAIRVSSDRTVVLGLTPTGTGVEPSWSSLLPAPLNEYFQSFPFEVVRGWITTPAAASGLTVDSEWWVDVPEVFETSAGLYQRLTSKQYADAVPPLDSALPLLDMIQRPATLRHQRYLWKLTGS